MNIDQKYIDRYNQALELLCDHRKKIDEPLYRFYDRIKDRWHDRIIKFGDYEDVRKEITREAQRDQDKFKQDCQRVIDAQKEAIAEIFSDCIKEIRGSENVDRDLIDFVTSKIVSADGIDSLDSFEKFVNDILVIMEFNDAKRS